MASLSNSEIIYGAWKTKMDSKVYFWKYPEWKDLGADEQADWIEIERIILNSICTRDAGSKDAGSKDDSKSHKLKTAIYNANAISSGVTVGTAITNTIAKHSPLV